MNNFNEQVERYFECATKVEEAIKALQLTCSRIDEKLDGMIYLLEKEYCENV